MSIDWKKEAKRLEELLKLRERPIGIKFIEKLGDIYKIPKVREDDTILTTCQRFMQARVFGRTIVATAFNTVPGCSFLMGLTPAPEELINGSLTTGMWCEKQEDAAERHSTFPIIPFGKHEALVISPLERGYIDPEIIIVYGNPQQIGLLINGYQWKPYNLVKCAVTGGSSCAVSVGNCYLTKEPSLAIPDYAEMRYAHAYEDELEIAFQASDLDRILIGMEELSKRGIRYPIPIHGAEVSTYTGMPKSYKELIEKQLGEFRKSHK
jgi:uncharacterized protein (DUF169 family)